MSLVVRTDVWKTRAATLADQQSQSGSSHPGIFTNRAKRGYQPHLASSRSNPVLPRHAWALVPSVLSPASSGPPTPEHPSKELLATSVKPPSTCSSTELSTSPEGSVRQVSTPSDCSADESGSRSPPMCVATPDNTSDGQSTPETARLPGSTTKSGRRAGALWDTGAPLPLAGSTVVAKRRDPPVDTHAGYGADRVPLYSFHRPLVAPAVRHGSTSAAPFTRHGSSVIAARAAATTAKRLSSALSTELRDLEGEMEELTRELFTIKAAVPDSFEQQSAKGGCVPDGVDGPFSSALSTELRDLGGEMEELTRELLTMKTAVPDSFEQQSGKGGCVPDGVEGPSQT